MQLIHGNCRPRRKRLSWESRCEIVAKVRELGMTAEQAAACSGVHRSTVYRLLERFDEGGWEALRERPSTPKAQPRRLAAELEAEIVAVRRRTSAGPQVIGANVGRAASTVGKVLRRQGCSRLPKPERDPIVRYERERAGELVHVDTKRLNRFWQVGKAILRDGRRRSSGAGWHFLHVAIDDYSRLAYAEVLASEDGEACAAFLARALAWYRAQGVSVERVLTDNAGAYRSRPWRLVCARHRVRRRFTRPYRPQTNGKAEALIKTLLREWAYRFAYPTSHHRTRALPGFIRWYNRRRPHSALGGRPPLSRVADLCGQYT
jgi:transposase InsO family protein